LGHFGTNSFRLYNLKEFGIKKLAVSFL